MPRLFATLAVLGAVLAAPLALTIPAQAAAPAHAARALDGYCPPGYHSDFFGICLPN